MQLQKASRKKVKIKMSLASPTGFGKTISALLIAYGMTDDWSKIAVIDTENESASLYANHQLLNGFIIGEFQTITLSPPFEPEKYSKAIKICEDDGSIEVIIVDSITHVWQGQGGLLEYNTSLGSNTFQNWAKTTPRYQKWLNSILQSKCHVITTSRKKQAYALVEDNGKKKVEKQGMEDQIRDGYDYEMTIAFEIINDQHMAKPAKDRTGLFADKPEFVITSETGKIILAWCNAGKEAISSELKELPQRINECKSIEELLKLYYSDPPVEETLKNAFTVKRGELEKQSKTPILINNLNHNSNGTIHNSTTNK